MDASPLQPYVVYIAYASEDRWVARKLADDLRAVGAQPWFDVWDIHGRRIDTAMLDGIRRAAEMIVVASQEAVSNAYVAHEVGGMALAGKPVTLLLFKLDRREIPSPWNNLARLDLNDSDEYMVALGGRLRSGT